MDAEAGALEPGQLVPDDVSPRDLRAEATLRAQRAGYDVTRDGGPPRPKIQGVCPWGQRKLNVWPRDGRGELIDD